MNREIVEKLAAALNETTVNVDMFEIGMRDGLTLDEIKQAITVLDQSGQSAVEQAGALRGFLTDLLRAPE